MGYEFTNFDTISSLRAELTGIQCGEVPDKHGWMQEVCDVVDDKVPLMPDLSVESHAPGMVDAEMKGTVQELGAEALHGLERFLLSHVVETAEAGNPESVLSAMDDFWNSHFQKQGADQWNVRGISIEDKVKDIVKAKSGQQVRCLELGTYCGYSALRIARNLPEGSTLVSVEKDALFGAIATKIVEFAGLENKVKIWMGTVHSELTNITSRLEKEPADFVLCDHSKERFVPDLKLMEECGIVSKSTEVVGDVAIYPGDVTLPKEIQKEISDYFQDQGFKFATMV